MSAICGYDRQIGPAGGVAGGEVFLAELPAGFGVALDGEEDGVFFEFLVEGVHEGVDGVVAVARQFVEEVELGFCCRENVIDHDAGFFVAESFLVDHS